MTFDPIRLGVIGLGRGFVLTLPALRGDPRVELVAACARNAEQRTAFEAEFGGRAHADPEAFFADPDIEAVYIATPHGLHAEHTAAAARAGKHVLVDKPMAIAMDEADAMVRACEDAGVSLIVGPSHSFDAPVAQACALIEGGTLGRVRMIHALNYTDFLYRPRRPEELRAEEGGVVLAQAIHQVDVVRRIAGGVARQVTAAAGAWDADRAAPGAYAALVTFEDGAFASLTYSGYGRFDSDEWMGWAGELGHDKDPDDHGRARRALDAAPSPEAEAALKRTRIYGAAEAPPAPRHHEHFGPVLVSCENGDMRLTPDGLWVYGERSRRFEPAPNMQHPRTPVVDALVGALRDGVEPVQTGRWGLASLEICHAILTSAETGVPVRLSRQIGTNREGAQR